MRISHTIKNQNERDGHLREVLAEIRLAHRSSSLGLRRLVENCHHALMAPTNQFVEL